MAPIEVYPERIEQLSLPPRHRARLREAVQNLITELPQDIVSLAVYGSAARGDWDEAASDINVVVVLRDLAFGRQEAAAQALATARRKARVVPLLTTTTELREASDVFCIELDDIRRHHVSVAGEEVLDSIHIELRDLRFVAEFGLRTALWRLRKHFAQSHGERSLEQSVLLQFYANTLPALLVTANLRGTPTPDQRARWPDAIGAALGVDVSVLRELQQLRRGDRRAPQHELVRMFGAFNALIGAAVQHLQRLEDAP